MSTNHTPNYQLSQWKHADKVLMEDFNEDNAKIDAALKSEADARTELSAALGRKADQTALNSLQSALNSLRTTVSGKQDSSGAVRLAAGSYTGNGDGSNYRTACPQTISLPFTPKAVIVVNQDGKFYNSNGPGHLGGALAVTGSPGIFKNHTTLEISGRGFTAYTYYEDNSIYIRLNDRGDTYHYIALG